METHKRLRSVQLEVPYQPETKIQCTCLAPALSGSDRSSSPLLGFLLQREDYYPVFDRICSYLGIEDIISLTRTCKRLSSLYQVLLSTQWNVDRALRRFVDNPHQFRSKLGEYNAIVSGSFALQFFDRVVWPESDLDIFILDSRQEGFMAYLCESEGYVCDTTEPRAMEYEAMIDVEVRTYVRSNEFLGRTTKIQLIGSELPPLRAILRGFYTSAVVNIITWNKAYAIFPSPTFVHRKTYLFKALTDYIGTLLLKYSRRGWKAQPILWSEERTSSHPFQSARRIGDKYTWTIPFDTHNVRCPSIPDSVLEYSFFSITDIPNGMLGNYYEIRASVFHAGPLLYAYLYPPRNPYLYSPRVIPNFWLDFVGERMEHLTRVEACKMNPDDRPKHFDPYQNLSDVRPFNVIQTDQLPDTWTFYDDEIPKWHKTWEQSLLKNTENQTADEPRLEA